MFSFPFSLALVTCWLFLLAMGALSSLVGFALRMLHPTVAALVNFLLSYFVVAFTTNSTKTWAISPLAGAFAAPFSFFTTRNWAISVLVAFCLVIVIGQFLAIIVTLRHV